MLIKKKEVVKIFTPAEAEAIATYFAQLVLPETCARLEKLVDYLSR